MLEIQVTAISGDAFIDLDGQFAGWRKDQGLDAVVLLTTGLFCLMEVLQNGNRKGSGLTGSCLGASQEITAR